MLHNIDGVCPCCGKVFHWCRCNELQGPPSVVGQTLGGVCTCEMNEVDRLLLIEAGQIQHRTSRNDLASFQLDGVDFVRCVFRGVVRVVGVAEHDTRNFSVDKHHVVAPPGIRCDAVVELR